MFFTLAGINSKGHFVLRLIGSTSFFPRRTVADRHHIENLVEVSLEDWFKSKIV